MDLATIIGVLLAFGAIMGSMILEGGSPMALLKPGPLLLIFVGSTSAALASTTIPSMLASFKWLIYAIKAKPPDMNSVIGPLVKMAEKARQEGLLALEADLEDVTDPFMKKGMQMAVDGTDPDDLFEILAAEVKAKKAAVNVGAGFFNDVGGYSPTIGIIGTVLGLVTVLENLSEPAKLGHLIAGAFVATLWGILSANVMFLPFGKRIKVIGMAEAARMELIIEGVLAIQAGANPRVVASKLKSKIVPLGPAAIEEAA